MEIIKIIEEGFVISIFVQRTCASKTTISGTMIHDKHDTCDDRTD